MLRIFTIVFFTIIFATGHAFSFDLDMTVDDDIRKNYNSSKLVKETEELPVLPEKLKNEKTYSATKENILQRTPTYTGNIKISKGTTFEVVNIGQISDWQQKGTIVKFKTNKPINKKKYSGRNQLKVRRQIVQVVFKQIIKLIITVKIIVI